MGEFIQALLDPDIGFLMNAFLVGILASFAFGIVGTYVVARRISYIAGAISHSVLGGIGISLFLQQQPGWSWLDPLYGATIAALMSAIIIGMVSRYARQREDTVIGAIWAIGMAVGLIFIAKTPGYVDPMSYLFGNILLISSSDVWLVAGLDVVVLTGGLLFYNKILAVCFDDEHAILRGIRAELYYMLLLCLTALTVVLMVNIVGIVLVIALLTLPPAIASFFSRTLWQMMILAVFFGIVFTTTGLMASYTLDLPAGPTIIVIAGFVYLSGAIIVYLFRRWRVRSTTMLEKIS